MVRRFHLEFSIWTSFRINVTILTAYPIEQRTGLIREKPEYLLSLAFLIKKGVTLHITKFLAQKRSENEQQSTIKQHVKYTLILGC